MVSFFSPGGSQYRMFRNSVPNYAFYIQLRHDWRFQKGCIIDPLHRQVILIGGLDRGQPPPTPTPSNQRWNWESGCYMWPAGIFLNYFFKAFWWRFDKGCTSCVALCYRQSSVMDHWALCCSGAHIVHFCRAPASCLSFHQLCFSLPAARLRKMRQGHAS